MPRPVTYMFQYQYTLFLALIKGSGFRKIVLIEGTDGVESVAGCSLPKVFNAR